MSTVTTIAIGIALLPALAGWVFFALKVVAWWRERRFLQLEAELERAHQQQIARFNAEMVSLAAARGVRAKRGRVLRMVSHGTSR